MIDHEFAKTNLRYWLDKGVDGFRLDAAPKIVEDDRWPDEPTSGRTNDTQNYKYLDHIYTIHQPETKDILKSFYNLVKSYGNDK